MMCVLIHHAARCDEHTKFHVIEHIAQVKVATNSWMCNINGGKLRRGMQKYKE